MMIRKKKKIRSLEKIWIGSKLLTPLFLWPNLLIFWRMISKSFC